ncbi:hypothetical protein Tco_1368338 [Tanacetum coccineum]
MVMNFDDEDSDNKIEGANVEGAKSDEDATDEKDQGNEAVEDTNTDLDGGDAEMTDVILPQVQATQEIEDTHVTLTLVNPDGQQQSSSITPCVWGEEIGGRVGGGEEEAPSARCPSDEEVEGPLKDQPLSADASPTALSPGYIADSDPEEDKEDPEEDPADHPADR